jgi:hypothetical protein
MRFSYCVFPYFFHGLLPSDYTAAGARGQAVFLPFRKNTDHYSVSHVGQEQLAL